MRYQPGYFIGSEGPNGEHLRDETEGWPFSIYRKASEIGVTDAVLCHGIQSLADARQLLALCNGTERPEIENAAQMFAWK